MAALGTPGGVVSDEDHRLAMAGMIAPQTSTLAVRTGVLWGPGSTTLVTGTSATGTMTVAVAALHLVSTRGAADGVYLGTLAAATTVTIAAAPGSNSRIDVVYVKQNDSGSSVSPDGATTFVADKVTGTAAVSPTKPSIPVGAVEIATVTVAAGATATNGSGVTIANTAAQTVARGADVPVRNQAERDALTTFPLLTVKRLDTGAIEARNVGNTGWVTIYDPTKLSAWSTYTPTWLSEGAGTPPSVGDGVLAGRYRLIDGKTGVVKILCRIGNAASGGSGTVGVNGYSFSLPPGWVAASSVPVVAPGWFKSASDEGPLTGLIAEGASKIYPIRGDQNNVLITNGLLTAAGHFLTLTATVELA